MSLKMIKPFSIDNSVMTSSISEPDLSQGEVEWYAKDSGFDVGFYVASVCNTGDGYLTCLEVPFGASTSLVKKVDVSDGTVVSQFSIAAQTTTALTIVWNNVHILVCDGDNVYKYTNAGVFVSSHVLTLSTGSASIGWDGAYVLMVNYNSIEIIRLNPDFTEKSRFSPEIDGVIHKFGYAAPYYYVTEELSKLAYQFSGDSKTGVIIDMSKELYSELYSITGIDSNIYACDFQQSIFVYDSDFNSISNYDEGHVACVTSDHSLYVATTSTPDNPVDGALLTPPTWVRKSATNKYKAFDYVINTKSVFDSSTLNKAIVTLTPGKITTNLAIFGLERVTGVNVRVFEDDATGAQIYPDGVTTISLTIEAPPDDIAVNEIYLDDKIIFDDLPDYANPHIIIIFRSDDDTCKVGDIVVGNSRTLGVTTYQSSTTRTSYDTVDTDDFGNETITSRPSAEYTSFEVVVFPKYANYVERILKESLNQPRVWFGEKPNNEKLFTFGYYERSPITYSSPAQYETTLKVRGLV